MTRVRRLGPWIPVAVAVTAAAWIAPAGCGWEYAVDPALGIDAGDDAGVDAPEEPRDSAFVLPDGRVCTGHDEDGDGVPDECDNCPNVANPDQSGAAIGAACAPDPALVGGASRIFFHALRSLTDWKAFGSGAGAFEVAADGDAIIGGSVSDELRFVSASTGAGSSAAVVTTTLTVLEDATTGTPGTAGVLLRISADAAPTFFLCAVNPGNGFAIARAPDGGCDGGLCAPFLLSGEGDAGGAQKPIPADVPHALGDVIGVRATITAGGGDAGAGEIECRVFDPSRPETLRSSAPEYAVRVPVAASRWIAAGEIGLYAQRSRARFGSVDVLSGP